MAVDSIHNTSQGVTLVPFSRPKRGRLQWLLAGVAWMGLGLGGCDAPSVGDSASDPPTVVATSTIIYDLTQTIGGDQIELIGILEPGTDPHVYEPVPADSVALEQADLILYNGYDLEPGLIRIMEAVGGNAVQVAVGEAVEPLQMENNGQRVPDPHVWGNAENTVVMVEAIADALSQVAPDDAAQFTRNADQLSAQLQDLHGWITDQVATIPADQRKLVTTHDAFQYYASAYGLTVVGTLVGISTEEQPSAQTVQQLVEAIRGIGVNAIFAETTINPRLITTVAEEAGVELAPQELYSDSIGAAGSDGDSYIKMMVSNTQTIVEALGGTYTPFSP